MHSAPSVIYPVGRSRFLAAVLGAFWVAAAGVSVLWWRSPGGTGWRLGLVWLALALAGLMACRLWQGLGECRLLWDGRSWRSLLPPDLQAPVSAAFPAAEAQSGQMRVHLDMQRHMLLRWQALDDGQGEGPGGRIGGTVGPVRWFWADAAADPVRWHAFRCAVYSRAMNDTPHPRETGAANP
jgi:hypothetical protein